jgi:hypothetical protein
MLRTSFVESYVHLNSSGAMLYASKQHSSFERRDAPLEGVRNQKEVEEARI